MFRLKGQLLVGACFGLSEKKLRSNGNLGNQKQNFISELAELRISVGVEGSQGYLLRVWKRKKKESD